MTAIALIPSVKAPSKWRSNDPRAARADLEFERVKPVVLRRAQQTCAGCGSAPVRLEVHHRNNNHADNSLNNLVGLCRYCHAVFHAGFHQAGLRGSIDSMWYCARAPLPAGLQAAMSRWALHTGSSPMLPPGSWLTPKQAAAFIAELVDLAEDRHAEPAGVRALRRHLLWVPKCRIRRPATVH